MAKQTDATTALATVVKALRGVPEAERAWVLQSAASYLSPSTPVSISGTPPPTTTLAGTQGVTSNDAKAFLRAKKPQDDVQRVACLAYVSAHSKDARQFKADDLKAINVEAAGPTMDMRRAVDNASRRSVGFLSTVGKGFKQLTALGEDVVNALPDYEKVKEIRADDKRNRRRKGRRKSKKSA